MNRSMIKLIVVFFGVLLGSALLVYLLLDRTGPRTRNAAVDAPAASAGQTPTPAPAEDSADSLLTDLFGADAAATDVEAEEPRVLAIRIFLRFLIAAILASVLAFRWRRGVPLAKRNPYVAQTQILLAVVAAAMMMVVGDSAARAFGIFAAASLVRFRTNIRDPKETTVLLICLGVGLASGVGRMDLALILTFFVLLMLWILEHFESAQVFRSMEVTVGTRNLDQTHQVLKRLFAKHDFTYELRQLDRTAAEGENGKIVYELSLGTSARTEQLSEEILAEDGANISSLEWDQKKSTTYIYR